MKKAKKLAIYLLLPIMCLCLSVAFLIKGNKVSAEEAKTFEMKSVAVRLDANTPALRFTGAMTDAYYRNAIAGNGENGKDVSFGALIIPAKWITEHNLEAGNYIPSLREKLQNENDIEKWMTNSKAFQNVDAEGVLINAEDTNWYIQASKEITTYNNWNDEFVAIGFVKTVIAEGETTYQYAAFDEKNYRNATNAAFASLNVSGYEDNETLQEIAVKGVYQMNGETETAADNADFNALPSYLGLEIAPVSDHIQEDGQTTYTLTSKEGKQFPDCLKNVVSENETVLKVQNGAFIGAGEGLAAASVKFGNLTLAQTSLYVGREALALYDIEYDQTRNGRGMSVINAGSSSLHWGINSYANTPSLTDLPEEIASGYNVAFGEELKTKAYFLQVNQEKFETSTRQYRLSEIRLKLSDAKYVFENYSAVSVKLYVGNIGNSTVTDMYTGMYVMSAPGSDDYIISDRTARKIAYDKLGGWVELLFPLPRLQNEYHSGIAYWLTFGMDLQRAWNSADIYIGGVEFTTDGFSEKDLSSVTWTKAGYNGSNFWGDKVTDMGSAADINSLTNNAQNKDIPMESIAVDKAFYRRYYQAQSKAPNAEILKVTYTQADSDKNNRFEIEAPVENLNLTDKTAVDFSLYLDYEGAANDLTIGFYYVGSHGCWDDPKVVWRLSELKYHTLTGYEKDHFYNFSIDLPTMIACSSGSGTYTKLVFFVCVGTSAAQISGGGIPAETVSLYITDMQAR